jgi:hypothetical protein
MSDAPDWRVGMAWRICLVVALLSGACAKSATGMAVKET